MPVTWNHLVEITKSQTAIFKAENVLVFRLEKISCSMILIISILIHARNVVPEWRSGLSKVGFTFISLTGSRSELSAIMEEKFVRTTAKNRKKKKRNERMKRRIFSLY